MTTDQIRAELRRSACEDVYPFWDVHCHAFDELTRWKAGYKEPFQDLSDSGQRMFFLLVAEAMG